MHFAHVSRRAAVLAGLEVMLLLQDVAHAADAERPLTWIVPYAAGGGSDIVARLLGAALAPRLKQGVVVENRPGGATSIGAVAAAKAAPDGLTVLTADNGTLVFNPALFRTLAYDPERDFRAVGLTVRAPLVLAVRLDSPSRSAGELIERARAEPGRIAFASAGIGSPHHLAMERLAHATGVRFNHVPYRGAAPALNDLVGGHVEAMMVDRPAGADQLRAGSIRPLAVCSAERLAALPDLPTIREALALPDFEAAAWQGLVVPKATPDQAVDRLARALAEALRDETVVARMLEIGLEPLSGGAAEMQRRIEAERAVWVPLIRSLGITIEG